MPQKIDIVNVKIQQQHPRLGCGQGTEVRRRAYLEQLLSIIQVLFDLELRFGIRCAHQH